MADYPSALSLEQLISKTSTICSPPLMYQRLNDVINHPRCSVRDISRVISEDQGLTARILRLANSPMFGYFSKVDSIERATTIIGTQQLRDLTLAATVMHSFSGIPESLLKVADFWRHGVSCGIVARNLAVYLRESNVERYFVAGMLHDLGQVILAVTLPEWVNDILISNRCRSEAYIETETRLLGYDHAAAGAALLRSWKIPANIVDPVSGHHQPYHGNKFPLETAVIHLADIICQSLELGRSGEWGVQPLDSAAWDRLDLPVSILETILKQSEPQLEETYTILAEAA